MPFDKSSLLDFLGILDIELTRGITIVVVGGTAMTLLDVKSSTIDIDFTIPSEDIKDFRDALEKIPHGFKIDYWADGMVFSQTLPDDYLEKSIMIKKFKNIILKALDPVDIVATKIGRLDERDLQDIKACIEKFKLKKKQIERRSKNVQYVGRQENYKANLDYVIKKFFEKKMSSLH